MIRSDWCSKVTEITLLVVIVSLTGCVPIIRPVDDMAVSEQRAALAKADEETVREVFDQFWSNFLKHEGAAAVMLVDSETVNHYQHLLEQARTISRQELADLGFLEKYTVLVLRNLFTRKELEAMSGADVFVTAVNQGWIVPPGTDYFLMQAGHVDVSGAEAAVSLATSPDKPAYFLVKESAGWKFAFWRMVAPSNEALQKEIVQSGQNEEELFSFLVVVASGIMIDPIIFEKPRD